MTQFILILILLCRFIDPDPSGFAGGLNFFTYANGNPVSYLDPFGLGAVESDIGGSWVNQIASALGVDNSMAAQQERQETLISAANFASLGLAEDFSASVFGQNLHGADVSGIQRGVSTFNLAMAVMPVLRIEGATTRLATDGAEILAGETAEGGGAQTFEILDGVRRAKANDLLGNQTVSANIFNADSQLIGQQNIPISSLLSPNKAAIDLSTQTAVDRYMSIQNALRQGQALPPINVMQGSRGAPVSQIIFDTTGGAH